MKVKEFKKMVAGIDSKYDDYDIRLHEKGSVWDTPPRSVKSDEKNETITIKHGN